MSDPPISLISVASQSRAYATLASAFADDPVERWLFPDDAGYAEHFPTFMAAVADSAFESRTARQLDDFGAVALWLPPGSRADPERVASVLLASVAEKKHAEMFAVLERMEVAHPTFAHWYLPWLGVDVASQGKGLGGQLLDAGLAEVDHGGLPVYLETPNPRNIPFYQRHGFEVVGQVELGSCPVVTFMLRDGR
jgi:ribosomal protein S18 acetylase RimI-like enzyme